MTTRKEKNKKTSVVIRQARADDIPDLIALQASIYPTIPPWNLPVEGLGMYYGLASSITPSDFSFARDGIAVEGTPNIEQIVVADVDLHDLENNHINGTTIPLYD